MLVLSIWRWTALKGALELLWLQQGSPGLLGGPRDVPRVQESPPGASYQDPTPSSPLTSETENTKDKKRKFRHKYSKMNVNYWLHSNHWFYLNTFLITTQSLWAQVRGRTWVVRWSSASLRGNVLALRHEKSREAFIVWLHSITSGTLTSPLIPPLVYITVVSLIP